ncbi:MAG: UbiH/UbiF/VisC/COQ6 family ubiquinone biosynthesis hydroxylase [Pseudomonadota bacterium]
MSPSPTADYDVIIVGGGLVGASLAALLAHTTKLSMAVLDRTVPPGPASPLAARAEEFDFGLRVSAISHATWRLLTLVRARPDPRSLLAYERMEVWEGAATREARIEFDCARLAEPCLGYIIDNTALLKAFYDVLHAERAVALLAPTGVAGITPGGTPREPIAVQLDDGRALRTRLVIGADGAESRVRSLVGIAARTHEYRQAGVVAHLRPERPHGATARQRFLADGPLALLPLADGRVSIVWSTRPEHAHELQSDLSPQAFERAVEEASEGVLGQLELMSARASFPLRVMHARRYTAPRVALVGDAAHVVHPLAGQGVNLGFLDAAALAGTLVDAVERGEEIGDHYVLERYERARKGENLATAAALDGLKRLFAARHPLVDSLRRMGLAAVDRLDPVKSVLARRAMGLSGNVPALLARRPPS